MSPPVIDLAGQRFGRLIVTKRAPNLTRRNTRWYVQCDCGNTSVVVGSNLKSGGTKSCGCWEIESRVVHGQNGSPEYFIWTAMKQRCVNPRNKAFKNYGARGISVCEKWRDSFQSFLDDVGLRPDPKLTIDRINNDGNYEPGNVRWATRSQQNLNTRRRLKLTTDDCHKIALDPRSQRLLAAEYSVARTTICRAKLRGAQAS